MNTEAKEMTIDRIENGVAVAYDRDGNEYTVCANIAGIKESDIVSATVNEHGQIIDITVLHKITKNKKRSLKDRLTNLFEK